MDARPDPCPHLVVAGTTVRWLSATGRPPPERVVEVDDRLGADRALRLATRRIGMLWRGDYRNARQLLAALDRRVRRSSTPSGFHAHRREQARRAGVLNMLLVPLDAGYGLALRHSPDVRRACLDVYPPDDDYDGDYDDGDDDDVVGGPAAVALRELLGVIGAREWRVTGIEVPALGARVHPHYGVFGPTRGEYVDLVAAAPLPAEPPALAYDVGTGTGVLAAVLVRRGVRRVLATDIDPRAVACARENVQRLGIADRVRVRRADLFPAGRADLVVCNPPWLPARPRTPLDRAVYDPGGRMLRGFLDGLAAHLNPAGEGWLVLSDLAELLGLRPRAELTALIEAAGLSVIARSRTRPRHATAVSDPAADPLRAARAAEVTSLWRLRR
ncbi:50S ribosomal protein L11 methyltransferase [Pseudonocardia acaciae]|uniref:50S ribosomal protein L11 methyltransferase n=1 Tax=Pseudonocardia acaciae TaxID=551276 RepID=UPI0006859818|nr:class I SAM-dependent methyltransferase [Pseudonocardia acaciae]